MTPVLNDGAAAYYDDAVHGKKRREPVRHGDDGPSVHEVAQCGLDLLFAFTVERARGFIEQKNWGVTKRCPGDGNTLPLSSGEFHSPVSDHSVVTVGE